MRPLLVLLLVRDVQVIHVQVDHLLVGAPLNLTLLINALSDWVALLQAAEDFLARDALRTLLHCRVVAVDRVHDAVCVCFGVDNARIFILLTFQLSDNA